MTLEEAKKIYFDYGCSEYAISRDDNNAANWISKVVTKQQKIQFDKEYMAMELEKIYSDSENGGYHFHHVATILTKRCVEFKDEAVRLVEIYKEAPFNSDIQKLIVAEWMLSPMEKNHFYSGYASLSFYGDFLNELDEATAKYFDLHFEEQENIWTIPYTPDKLNERVAKLRPAAKNAHDYIASGKHISDYAERERNIEALIKKQGKSSRRLILITMAAIFVTMLIMALLVILLIKIIT